VRVAVAYERLEFPAGTEVYVVTIAEQLQRLGHTVTIVTPREGPMSEGARRLGLSVKHPAAVTADDAEVVVACDSAGLLELSARAPAATRIMVVHSTDYVLQTPPQLDGACDAVVVLNDRTKRFAESLAVDVPVIRLRQPIDVARYWFLAAPRRPLRRAAVFGHVPVAGVEGTAESACRAAGIEPVGIGQQADAVVLDPERLIDETDAVIGIGRCALEGMAARRPVFVAGPVGADGWIRLETFDALESDGFSGRAQGRGTIVHDLAAALVEPPPVDEVQQLYERVQRDHEARVHAEQLIALARELGATSGHVLGPATEMARLVRIELLAHEHLGVTEKRLRSALERARALEEELATEREAAACARHDRDEAVARAAVLAARIEAIERSRRWRWTRQVLTPVDRLRRRLARRRP
jgi:hypothetical protein